MYFIAWVRDIPVGHAGFVLPDERDVGNVMESRWSPMLHDLEVRPLHRRKGIGRELVRVVEAEARARSHDRVRLVAGIDAGYAQARALYRSLGWIEEPQSLCIESARTPTDDGSHGVYMEIVTAWSKKLERG